VSDREAFDLLARTPSCTALGVGRMLERGHRVQDLAERMACPQEPPALQPYLTPSCPGYPALLKELKDPPLRLFHRGLSPARMSPHCVAVVGSRKASSYGVSWSRRLGAVLTRNGISVCSGLAEGIDAAAHRGALETLLALGDGCGVPVAVLGHGSDHVYPPQNRALRRHMEEHGIVLSEYPPPRPPTRYTFPERNRIIAGMCQTVVVVEAGQRSGSLHTARFANEAGRDVWVVPNRPGTPNSAGVLALLRDGACPMFDIDEFVGQLVGELRITHPREPRQEVATEHWPLLTALAQDEHGRPSELCARLGMKAGELAEKLAELEILGLVERRFNGTWALLAFDLVQQQLELCRERLWPGTAQAGHVGAQAPQARPRAVAMIEGPAQVRLGGCSSGPDLGLQDGFEGIQLD
jgi:DNA processing protein